MAKTGDELRAIASELYATEPARFTALRAERAKEARERGSRGLAAAVTALKKPSAAAWVVNALAREHPDGFDALADIAADLRDVPGGTGSAVELDERRRRTMADVLEHARDTATSRDVRLSSAALADVEATLRAVVADDDAARAARSGLLVRGLASTGWERIDVSDTLAIDTGAAAGATSARGRSRAKRPASKRADTTASRRDRAAQQARKKQHAAAEREIERAEDSRSRAAAAARKSASALRDAQRASDAAEADIQRITRELDDARASSDRADRVRAAAERKNDRAEEKLSCAERAVTEAKDRLKKLG